MTITRNSAIRMFQILGTLPLGNLDDITLEAMLENFDTFRKASESFDAMRNELFKRIYGDVENMSEDDKSRLTDFFELVERIAKASKEDAAELENVAKTTYAELYEKRVKEVKILESLLTKPIELDIIDVDGNAFCKGILRGKKDAAAIELHSLFSFMFKKAEKAEAEYSELDELLK